MSRIEALKRRVIHRGVQPVYEPEIIGYFRFEHSLTKEVVLVPENSKPEERFRYICDPKGIKHARSREMFEEFYPSDLPVEDFKEESVKHHRETHLSEQQKKLRSLVLAKYFGFVSPRKTAQNASIGSSGVTYYPDLHVGVLHGDHYLAHNLSELPEVQRLKEVNQTKPNIHEPENNDSLTRYDHSVHLGSAYAKTLTRFAILQPDELIKAVTDAITEHASKLNRDKEEIINIIESTVLDSDILGLVGENQHLVKSLKYAIWYGKYGLIYALLHDLFTPGFGDRFMKMHADFDYEKGADFSEDEELIRQIKSMVENQDSALGQLVIKFELDPELLVEMVSSYASEGDLTLNGLMMKAKLKGSSGLLFDELDQIFDLDQSSGTETNLSRTVAELLPGGHIYKKRSDLAPIGSFEERARLVHYMLLSGMNKSQLTNILGQIGFDEEMQKRVYIAAEEYAVWPNKKLKFIQDKTGKNRIMPVSVVPGDVKKAITMINVMYSGSYRVADFDVIESIVHRINSNLLYGDKNGKNVPLFRSDFIGKTDYEVAMKLWEVAPVVLHLMNQFEHRGVVLRRHELEELVRKTSGVVLAINEVSHGVLLGKEGTLVENDSGEVRPYPKVICRKRGESEDNPLSLPARLEKARRVLKVEQFKVMSFSLDEWKKIRFMIDDGPNSEIIWRGLAHWLKYIDDETMVTMDRKVAMWYRILNTQ